MNKQVESLHAIIFISSVTEILEAEEVSRIIEAERKQSESNGLSGIAMILGGNVLRLIEGEKKNVTEEFERAKRNPNIMHIIKLFDGVASHRYFESYVFMSDIHPGLNNFNSSDMDEYLEECFKIDTKEMRILRDFVKNNR